MEEDAWPRKKPSQRERKTKLEKLKAVLCLDHTIQGERWGRGSEEWDAESVIYLKVF